MALFVSFIQYHVRIKSSFIRICHNSGSIENRSKKSTFHWHPISHNMGQPSKSVSPTSDSPCQSLALLVLSPLALSQPRSLSLLTMAPVRLLCVVHHHSTICSTEGGRAFPPTLAQISHQLCGYVHYHAAIYPGGHEVHL